MYRLNLGSGDFPARGWVNVDSWAGNNPDVIADIRCLPFPDGCASHVYAGHVLEHLEYHVAVAEALVEVRRVLAPDGRAVFVTPDCGPDSTDAMRHGGHRWPGDDHQWEATAALLLAAVRRVFPAAQPVDTRTLTDWPVVAHVTWQTAVIV